MSKRRVSIKIGVAMVASMVVMLCGACGQQAKTESAPADPKQ
ncbi:MAG: hypothetical protein Q4E53_12065 [Eubacteriales bacterium]|nr:hypothetical protein [Eubacteriales bacterium]